MATPTVFVSYRRADSEALATNVANDLKQDLGLDNVFLDTEDLWPGDVFPSELEEKIQQSSVALIMIGRGWAGEDGANRLKSPGDWVRREVATALGADGDLIPVMIDGAQLPADLPDDIDALALIHQLQLDQSDYGVAYQSILVSVWQRVGKEPGTVLMVADDTDEAEVHIDEFISTLKGEDVTGSKELSSSVARGLRAVPLGDAAKRWPDVIVLVTEGAEESPAFLARVRGLVSPRDVAIVAGTGAVILGGQAAVASATTTEVAGGTTTFAPADLPSALAEVGEQASLTTHSSVSELGAWMKRGWWRALSTGVKAAIIAPVIAVGAVVGVVAATSSDPIALAGEWNVSDFSFASEDDVANSNILDGGRMIFEELPSCTDTLCPLAVVVGPPLLSGVVLQPRQGGSEYVGDAVNIVGTCEGREMPPDLVEASLTARAGSSQDLEFVISVQLESFGSCPAASAEYRADARASG